MKRSMRLVFGLAAVGASGGAAILWAVSQGEKGLIPAEDALGRLAQTSVAPGREAEWAGLVAAVGEVLKGFRVSTLDPHHLALVGRSLQYMTQQPRPSPEQQAYHVAFIEWALPRFLQDPPTAQETRDLSAQVDGLAHWVEQRTPGLTDDERYSLEGWRTQTQEIANGFLSGTALHPLSPEQMEAVHAAYERASSAPGKPHRLVDEGLGAASLALAEVACRPPHEEPPPQLQGLFRAMSEAHRRGMEAGLEGGRAKHRRAVLAEELRTERTDLEAWALALDALALTDSLAGGEWSCECRIEMAGRDLASLQASRAQDGVLTIATPRGGARWRWSDSTVTVRDGRLRLVYGPGASVCECPLAGQPLSSQGVRHFTPEEWAAALAAQAGASQRFWDTVTPLLVTGDKAGAPVAFTEPVGVLPFCATPRLSVAEPGEGRSLGLWSPERSAVGHLTAAGTSSEAGGTHVPAKITLELQPREVPAAATMRVTSGEGREAREVVWSGPVPATISGVVIALGSPAPAVKSVTATDAAGEVVCSISLLGSHP